MYESKQQKEKRSSLNDGLQQFSLRWTLLQIC